MKSHLALLAAASLLFGACSSIEYTSPEERTEGAKFATKAGVANLYLYRDNRILGAAVKWGVDLDNEDIGLLPIRTYMIAEVSPGEHTLSRQGSSLKVQTAAGRNYFVRVGAGSFELVTDEEGRGLIPKLRRVKVQHGN